MGEQERIAGEIAALLAKHNAAKLAHAELELRCTNMKSDIHHRLGKSFDSMRLSPTEEVLRDMRIESQRIRLRESGPVEIVEKRELGRVMFESFSERRIVASTGGIFRIQAQLKVKVKLRPDGKTLEVLERTDKTKRLLSIHGKSWDSEGVLIEEVPIQASVVLCIELPVDEKDRLASVDSSTMQYRKVYQRSPDDPFSFELSKRAGGSCVFEAEQRFKDKKFRYSFEVEVDCAKFLKRKEIVPKSASDYRPIADSLLAKFAAVCNHALHNNKEQTLFRPSALPRRPAANNVAPGAVPQQLVGQRRKFCTAVQEDWSDDDDDF